MKRFYPKAPMGALLAVLVALAPARTLAAEISLATEDVGLPSGYTIEPVLTGLTYPTSMVFGPDGSLYVAEAGHSYALTGRRRECSECGPTAAPAP